MQCQLCNTMCIIPQQPPPPWRDISPTGSFCTGTSGRLFTVQRWRTVVHTLSAEPSKVNISTHRSIDWSSALLEITREYLFLAKREYWQHCSPATLTHYLGRGKMCFQSTLSMLNIHHSVLTHSLTHLNLTVG